MSTISNFTVVECDVHYKWPGPGPVAYRLYVNHELFAERIIDNRKSFIKELLFLKAPLGKYNIRIEKLYPDDSKIQIKRAEVIEGPKGSEFTDNYTLWVGVPEEEL